MAHTDFAPYLRPEFPKLTLTASQFGYVYEYRFPQSEELTLPEIGEVWSDGLAVQDVQHTPSLDNSGLDELSLSTVTTFATTGIPTTATPEVRYSVRPQANQVELMWHTAFLPGGASNLFGSAVTSGAMTGRPIEFVMAWENEPNAVIKGQRKFYQRDGNGVWNGASAAISVPTGAAESYVKLRQLGYTTKDEYNPVWQKISVYTGSDIPLSDTWGQYVAAASVPGLPTSIAATYPQWIKTGDSAERIGTQARWQRTEEWTGYKKVYFDIDTLNPASNTLP